MVLSVVQAYGDSIIHYARWQIGREMLGYGGIKKRPKIA